MNESQSKIYSPEELLTEVLPVVRVTRNTREQLERIVNHGISPRMSDHIRRAIEIYIAHNIRAVEIDEMFTSRKRRNDN